MHCVSAFINPSVGRGLYYSNSWFVCNMFVCMLAVTVCVNVCLCVYVCMFVCLCVLCVCVCACLHVCLCFNHVIFAYI